MRYLLPVLFLPTLAHAHAGPHLHPHGIDAMWIIATVAVTAGGILLCRMLK